MIIEITQYMRPDGRQVPRELEIPDKYQHVIDLFEKHELCLTCESLMNGEAVQYISHNLGDFAIRTSQPMKPAFDALLDMLDKFDETSFLDWKARVN